MWHRGVPIRVRRDVAHGGYSRSVLAAHGLVEQAASSYFVQGDRAAVSRAFLMETSRDAAEGLVRLLTPALMNCYMSAQEKSIGELAGSARGSYARLRFPGVGDASGAYRVRFRYGSGARRGLITVDLVFIRRERALWILGFQYRQNRFGPAEEERLARALVARMPSAEPGSS